MSVVPINRKMKARDIVCGWPRGRSAVSAVKPFPFLDIDDDNAAWEDRWAEIEHDAEYHEDQARMMDDWHRSGGIAPSEYAHARFTGRLFEVKA